MFERARVGGASVMVVADVRESHHWRCPVIMKTAPGFVALTCARCGAIGIVGGGEPISELRVWGAAPDGAHFDCAPEERRTHDCP
jgi:hypothetical protein